MGPMPPEHLSRAIEESEAPNTTKPTTFDNDHVF